MPKFTKKRVVAVVAVSMLAIGGGAAYAYWTNSGTGTGTGTAATGTNSAVTVVQTSTVSNLAPGLPAQPLAGNFNNPNSSPVFVHSVHFTVTTDKLGCDDTDYTVVQPGLVNAEVPAGDGQGSWGGASIQFNDKAGVNQDACKNAVVTLHYTSD